MQVNVLHLRYLILISYLIVERLCDSHSVRSVCFYAQNVLALFFREDVSIADKSLIKVLRTSYKIVYAVLVRQFLSNCTNSLSDRSWYLEVACHISRVVIDVVSTEYFVCTLA